MKSLIEFPDQKSGHFGSINKLWVVLLAMSILAVGCKKKDDEDKDDTVTPSAYTSGIFVVNEGLFGSGSGTVSFYNRTTGDVTSKIFESKNGFPLGNIVQSVTVNDDMAYVVVNNANKVEVVESGDFLSTATITGLDAPRYVLVNGSRAYITEWGKTGNEGAVKVLNIFKNTIDKTISTGKGAERMAFLNNRLFVACAGGFGNDSVVSVINAQVDTLLTNWEVGPNPNSLQLDANDKLWVLCGGRWKSDNSAIEAPARLVRIDPSTGNVELTLPFSTASTASSLVINDAGDKLYYMFNSKLYAHDISSSTLAATPLISRGFYGLGFDPVSKYLYACDAGNFSSEGKVLRYEETGAVVDSFQVGVAPNGFAFH
ncbi:MAG: hypothetical protein KDD36_00800 [Flavobacteriales bacterium]|nr:hypothetical protein [Flavobacteriales bacterium]